MKNYTLEKEGEWKQVFSVVQTEEERIALSGPDSEERNAVIAAIKERSLVAVEGEDLELLESKYNEAKAKIEDVELKKYFLLGCNVIVADEDQIFGFLNAMVDDNYVKIDIK